MMENFAVVDLGFGDAGKGTTVDWLCRNYSVGIVVRFSGGAQAAHNVVTEDGKHHTFAQFGAGTLAALEQKQPILTYLSKYHMVEPFALLQEAQHLQHLGVPTPLQLLRIDKDCLVTTPFHAAVNRLREQARGLSAHGSCGIGVGETAFWALENDAPKIEDFFSPSTLRNKLTALQDYLHATATQLGLAAPQVPSVPYLVECYTEFVRNVQVVGSKWLAAQAKKHAVVFEGSQGVLLDQDWGFHPHTTWSTTTSANAHSLAADAGILGSTKFLGVLRSYTTRHGAGPFPTHDFVLDSAIPELHNGSGKWQGSFKNGHLDLVAHKYALRCAGKVDELVVTHVDRLVTAKVQYATRYIHPSAGLLTELPVSSKVDLEHQERLTHLLYASKPVYHSQTLSPDTVCSVIEDKLHRPVSLMSCGPTAADKKALSLAGFTRI